MRQFVIFAIPSYTRSCSTEFAASLADMAAKLAEKRISNAIFFLGGICFVDQARNICLHRFLQGVEGMPPATDLFFIDDDVGFPGSAVLDLLSRPEDIVFGAYPKKSDAPFQQFPVSVKLTDDDRLIWRDDLVQADTAPAGFLRIKRHVVEKLVEGATTYPYCDVNETVLTVPNVFECGARNGLYWGEDVSFSAKAQEAGFDLWCKPDIPFSHRGTKLWQGQMDTQLTAYKEQAK